MTDCLDDLIREIQEQGELSAEARNALHGCLSNHPWGIGKGFDQRKNEALFAIAARDVPYTLIFKLERMRSA